MTFSATQQVQGLGYLRPGLKKEKEGAREERNCYIKINKQKSHISTRVCACAKDVASEDRGDGALSFVSEAP